MKLVHDKIQNLIEYVKIDSCSVVCHFRCSVTHKRVASEVLFEPYEGKIELSWREIFLHPFRSYHRYYHTPIVIYAHDNDKTIVLKAFAKIARYFVWSEEQKRYIYKG